MKVRKTAVPRSAPISFPQELHFEEVAIVDPAILVGVHAGDLGLQLALYRDAQFRQPLSHFLW